MRINKDVGKLLQAQGAVAGGLRVQQLSGFVERMMDAATEASRRVADINAVELVEPGAAPDETVGAAVEALGDAAWLALMAIASTGLDAEMALGMRREHLLGGEYPLTMAAYASQARLYSLGMPTTSAGVRRMMAQISALTDARVAQEKAREQAAREAAQAEGTEKGDGA